MFRDLEKLAREHGEMFPINNASEWIDFASLYLVQCADAIVALNAEIERLAAIQSKVK